MKLSAFMQSAIEEYYANAEPFGKEGDFITAPEISQMFGEMIGIWITDLWMKMGQPKINVIEFGPGRGTLMSDIIRVTSKTINAQIYLIENSAKLIKQQKKLLGNDNAQWITSLGEIKNTNPSIVLGNEFLDALPIDQLMRTEKGWQMRTIIDNAFQWKRAEENLLRYLPQKTESNVVYEISLERLSFMKACEDHISKNNGAALFIDYGHTRSHHGETLQAVKRHQYVDVLENAGNADITSHVDFDALIRETELPKHITNQRLFLMKLGIEKRAEILSKQKDVGEDLKRLIANDEMGQLFKVVCLHSQNIQPAGF